MILKADAIQAIDRFVASDLNPVDFGVPIIPAARRAISAMLAYISPSEEVRISDLQSIEHDTGVDGALLGDWLTAIGLAELSGSVDQFNGGEVIRLNPILRHRVVLRGVGLAD